MSNRDSKTYYWIKLTEDFFDGEEIKIIENMPNGKDYIIFYLKLLLKTMNTNGELTFRGVMPYSVEMLSAATNTNPDIIRSAIDIFIAFDMMEKWDNGHLFMVEVQNLVGSETGWAKKKRIQRTNARLKGDNVPQMSLECPTEYRDKSIEIRDKSKEYRDKSIELELELELDKEIYSPAKQDDIPYSEIVSHLNLKADKNYKATSRKTKDLIRARWNEGFEQQDFIQVIDNMTSIWKEDKKMSQYLRPSTLFGTKFEEYLNTERELSKEEKTARWLKELETWASEEEDD